MIYTLGNRESYTKYLEKAALTGIPCLKKGRTIDYSGGYAFKTAQEAKNYATTNNLPFTVFILDASWDDVSEDTIPVLGHGSLIRDAVILGEFSFSSSGPR